MQPYPRSPDLVWPGQLHGTGCLSARAVDTRFPTVVRRLCLGPGCGWVWAWLTPPVLAGVLGGCVWARFVVLSLFCRLFVVFVVGLRFRPAYGTCVVACALRLPSAVAGFGVRCGRACWGLGFNCALPLLGGVLGCVFARAPVLRGLLDLLVGVAVRGCVFVRAPRLFPAFPGWGAVCGRACWARVSAVPRPSWLGCRGVFFALFFRGVPWLGFVVRVAGCPCPGPCGPCPPNPFLSGWAAVSLFFFFQRGVCLHVSVSLFPVGRCSWRGVASFGRVVPLCLFGGPVFGAFCVGGLAASCDVGGRFGGCGLFSHPPSLPPLFYFFGGGAACSSLCLSWAGARTGPHSVWSSGLLLAVAFCLAVFRPHGSGGLCTRWARRPFSAGLGPGSAGWAAAPGGCVWLWVRRLGLSVSLLPCGAGFNLLGGPPPLLPGARWPRVWPAVPVCGVLVRRLPGCAVACFG